VYACPRDACRRWRGTVELECIGERFVRQRAGRRAPWRLRLRSRSARGDQVVYEPAVDIEGWLGRIQLGGSDGQPLPTGDYSLVVTTSVGSFVAEIEVADTFRFDELGRYSATAEVCGLSLRVYRLVTEDDNDAHVTLRLGDRLLVALEGNPTTGYQWANTLVYEFATLREIGEPEFRPDSDLVGAGGLFLFRYEAVRVGPQAFRFAYQRPWESVQPLRLLEFSVDVH